MTDDSFEHIINKNEPLLRRLCRVYTDRRSDAEDLFQEIIIQIWKSLSTFEQNANIKTWVYRVAVNTAISFQRKKNTRKKYYQKYQAEQDAKKQSTYTNRQSGTQNIDRLYAAIDQLDASEKAIISMYLEDFSYEEIAFVTDLTENYVGVKLHRIKNKISKIIEEQNGT